VAVLIADTGYELYAACETVRDLDQLYSDLGMDNVTCSACDPELPDVGEVWAGVVEKSGEWVDQAKAAMQTIHPPVTNVISLARIYLRSPPGIADNFGRESVAFVGVHPPILSIFGDLTCQYPCSN
jgi:hypothetical protein